VSVTAPPGFSAAAAAGGIKAGSTADLALVAVADGSPVPVAAVFTRNRAAAAPVELSRRHVRASQGHAAAVVLSSGNANAATGDAGRHAAEQLCAGVATGLGVEPHHVLVCQTGLIGVPFPLEPAVAAVPSLVQRLSPDEAAAAEAARAIMTTDTVPKTAVVRGHGFTVGAMAKGAAMLAPDMATMLAVLTTDATCEPRTLHETLASAVVPSFNSLTIDGCTSTNDTVVILANGRAPAPAPGELRHALLRACTELAGQMAADAEGATKTARVEVRGAASDDEARRAARNVADSLLVKCSLNGDDPHWGRVVSELGSAGITFELDRVSVSYGGVEVCRRGAPVQHDEGALRSHMRGPHVVIGCDLGLGPGTSAVLTTDLGYGYLDENRRTS
jgi:glutamate N-acetyltransferase / amino-acid N-acetyltransferase